MRELACDRSLIRIGLGAALSLLLAVGCGDDDSNQPRDSGTPRDAGDRGDAASTLGEGGIKVDASAPPVETDQLADGVVGSSCKADGDCGEGRCRLEERITGTLFPGGYCTGSCIEDADCGARGLCTPGFRGSIGSCALRCDGDVDCDRDGYRCRVSLGIGRCVPGPEALPDHVVGNACTSDDDCGGARNTCASALANVDAPGGYCSQACAVDADCGAEGTCVSGLNGITLSTGTCYQSCVIPNGCRDGYTCHSLNGIASDERGVCSPDQPSDDAGVD